MNLAFEGVLDCVCIQPVIYAAVSAQLMGASICRTAYVFAGGYAIRVGGVSLQLFGFAA